jgi:DNA-binding transcriptional LysR family regulator
VATAEPAGFSLKIKSFDYSCFDLIDLRLFVNVAETSSLTGGAERSNMSLPAASTRIRDIETGLSTKLLYRTGHGVLLTPAGRTFLHHGRLILRQLEHMSGDLQEYSQGLKGHVRIFANTTALEFLPNVLRKYLSNNPHVNIDLRERLSKDIAVAVSEGVTDIGIVAGNVNTTGLQVLPYRQDRLVLVTSKEHPLAEKTSIQFGETLDFYFIALVEGSAVQTFLKHAANDLNRHLKIRIEVGNFDALCRMIEANVGIGILPESAARRHGRTLAIKIIPLSDEWAARNQQICLRDFNLLPKFAKDLVNILIEDGIRSPVKEPIKDGSVSPGGRKGGRHTAKRKRSKS